VVLTPPPNALCACMIDSLFFNLHFSQLRNSFAADGAARDVAGKRRRARASGEGFRQRHADVSVRELQQVHLSHRHDSQDEGGRGNDGDGNGPTGEHLCMLFTLVMF